jgi:uncharacterized repeat protein (TIGR01451 family)
MCPEPERCKSKGVEMSRSRLLIASATLLAISIGLETVPAAGQIPPPGGGVPIVRAAVAHDTSPPLRDIQPVPFPEGATNVPALALPGADEEPLEAPDPALQTSPSANDAPPPTQTFEGQSNSENFPLQVNPPDTVGDVGPNHYVQMTNLITSIYDKRGNRLLGPVNNNTFWAGMPGTACPIHNWGDPIVLYDQFADRWMLSQFAFAREPAATGRAIPPFYECVAISATPDPTGAYHRYEFLIDDTLFNDYPKFGVWPDAYYMSVNQFNTVGSATTYAGPGAVAFEREKMLQGQPARMVYFDLSTTLGTSYRSQLPSDADGMTPPPAGAPNYFIEADDRERFPTEFAQDQLTMWEFHVDWNNPANSTFGANAMNDPNAILPTAPFDSNMCNFARACIPEKGVAAADYVDALSGRLMHRAQYRNFGTHETLVANHTVDVGDSPDHAGIRWYELRDPGGTPTIAQQSTYAPDAEHRWMGSIAMNGLGDIGLGYSVSSADRFPAISHTGRLATDPPGTMQNEALMFAGSGSQVGSGNRWGDYSSMNVDPTDDCTFWYTQEYYATTDTFAWRTRIGSFKLPNCGDMALAMTDSPDPVIARTDVTYTAVVLAGATPMSAVTLTDPLPSGVTFVSATPSHGTCTGGTTVTCNLGDLAAGALATVRIVVRTGGAAVLTNTASVASASPDPNPANNTASVPTTVVDPCALPGLTVLTDPTGDATGGQPYHDIQRISVAEPFFGDGVSKLVFTLKMANLSTVPPNHTWPVSFFTPDTPANVQRFVAMKTNAAGQVSFVYGTGSSGATVVGNLDPESNFNPDGTITLVVSNSKIGNPGPGQVVNRFLTRVRIEPGITPDNAPNGLIPSGSYTLFGNEFCRPLDLSVDKQGPARAPTARTMTYTANVTNNGPGTATGVLLTDDLPGSVTFVSASATQGTCSGAATVTCSLGTINEGQTVTVTIQVTPRQVGPITNRATVISNQVEANSANNTDTVVTSVCRLTSRRSSSACG